MTREYAAGEVLDGRYRLVDRLGRGGFGDVWRAEELLPDGEPFREVALKLLVSGFTDAQDWVEEAKMLASFRHPSLVTIYATGIFSAKSGGSGADGEGAAGGAPLPYVAMELLLGETLADQLKARRRIPWRRVLSWARDTAAALDVIHARGVVHLDLKPANLYLSHDGALKVLDFGIARRAGGAPPALAAARAMPLRTALADDALLGTAQFVAANDAFAATQASDAHAASPVGRNSMARAVIGTPGFMAPEVIESGEPTAAADAYALAVVVVQLATGHFPQECPDEPVAWNDVHAVSAWLSELRAATLAGKLRDIAADPAKLPRGLVALLTRLLAVDPIQRQVIPGRLRALFDDVWQRPHGVPTPPYPGLAIHGSAFEGALFGRDDDVIRLGRELAYEPCVVLQGARRSGKSSLSLAGLVPYLARRAVSGCDDWVAVHVEPGDAADVALAKALAAVDPALETAGAPELAAWAEAQRIGVVVVIDPLDEMLGSDRCEKTAALVQAIVATRPPRLRVVGTLFEARAADLLAETELGPALHASLRFVGPPATAAVRDLVAGPAELAGVRVRGLEIVTADVQRELRAEGGRLPFVALALRAWWSTRSAAAGGESGLEGARWKALGGVSGALAQHASDVLAHLPPERRAIAHEILLRLSSSEKQLVAWPEDELLGTFGAPGAPARAAAESVAGELIRQSLVVRRGKVLSMAHEALATSFPELEARRMEDLERWVFLERLREAAINWQLRKKPEHLWLGAALREVGRRKAWIARGLSGPEQEFLAASRRRDRRRILARAAMVAAVILGALGVVFAKRASDAGEARVEARRKAAEERAYLAEIAAKSRRTEDPYHRAAYIAEAVEKGSTDGMLPLDLASAVATLPSAEFLTLDAVSSPAFYWGDRFLLAGGPGPALSLIDFDPREAQVIDVKDLTTDPKLLRQLAHPRVSAFMPAGAAVVERVPFAFDTSFVTRSAAGDVLVWRVRERGDVALAATAPMKCAGAVRVAATAPVVACPTDDGFVRWDLRARGGDAILRDPFQATFVDVSADGSVVAGVAGKHVRLLATAAGPAQRADLDAQAAVVIARFSPRDRVLALVEPGSVEVVDVDRPESPVFRAESEVAPVAARWDDGGLDLAVCAETGEGAFVYLRAGNRAASDPPPAASKATPCAPPPRKGQPAPIVDAKEIPEMRDRDLGPHSFVGGWKLPDGRYLTRDLLLVRRAEPASQVALAFRGRDGAGGPDPRETLASASAFLRSGGDLAWQIGGEVRIYGASDGRRVLSRRGNLLGLCPSGRLVAWAIDGGTYRVFDVKSDATIGAVTREPSFVLAIDHACTTLYTQRVDGAIVAAPFAPGPAARVLAQADGYVFDVRPSAARGALGPGFWIAASSGAVARVDEASGAVHVVAYAGPYAWAIGDGPSPGDLVYADAAGVSLVSAGGGSERLLTSAGGVQWEDLATAPDGATVLLAAADKVAILDLELREIVGSMPMDGRGRLSPWDEKGSLVAWSESRVGGAEGDVIPRSSELVKAIAESASNLGVDRGRLVLRSH